jgi:hypothetical protein
VAEEARNVPGAPKVWDVVEQWLKARGGRVSARHPVQIGTRTPTATPPRRGLRRERDSQPGHERTGKQMARGGMTGHGATPDGSMTISPRYRARNCRGMNGPNIHGVNHFVFEAC